VRLLLKPGSRRIRFNVKHFRQSGKQKFKICFIMKQRQKDAA
jgi:hypothetical protein